MSRLQDLQQQVYEFALKTFGEGREDAAWKKLFEELGEVLKRPRDPAEWGDVFILLLDLATIYDVDVEEATRLKLEKIRDRVWAKTETGTFQHVPGATQQERRDVTIAVSNGGPLQELHGTKAFEFDLRQVLNEHELATLGHAPAPSTFQLPGDTGCYNLIDETKIIGRKARCYHYKYDPDGVPF